MASSFERAKETRVLKENKGKIGDVEFYTLLGQPWLKESSMSFAPFARFSGPRNRRNRQAWNRQVLAER